MSDPETAENSDSRTGLLPSNSGASVPKVCVFIVSFRRQSQLLRVLQSLMSSPLTFAEIVVVDNEGSDSTRAICDRSGTTYLPQAQNTGPAGGSAVAMRYFSDRYSSGDWLMRCDDDIELDPAMPLSELLQFAEEMRGLDPSFAAAGLEGRRVPNLTRRIPPLEERQYPDAKAVDYLSTNSYPLWPLDTIRRFGTLDPNLFFGHTEVEYGLRLRREAQNLWMYVNEQNPLAAPRPETRRKFLYDGRPDWRRFYATRNGILLARRYAGWRAAVWRTAQLCFLKPVVNMTIQPFLAISYLKLECQASLAGWRGQLGRTIDPLDWNVKHGGLDEHHEMPATLRKGSTG